MAKSRRVSRLWQRGEEVSYIRLSGRWLEELGFAKGRNFDVLTEHGRLVLVVREPDVNDGNGTGTDPKAPGGYRRGR